MFLGILLPWIGGLLPSSVGYLCASIAGGGQRTAELLLIYEKAKGIQIPWTCHHEVQNILLYELCHGCIADLHAKELISFVHPNVDENKLKKLFRKVFQLAPSTLAEFKPVWGHVFASFLQKYTHWTYTDTDMIFGQLDLWLLSSLYTSSSSSSNFDIETWTFENDLERLFLRGQFTIHKNAKNINLSFQKCNHFTTRLEENLQNKLNFYYQYGPRPSTKAKKNHRSLTDATHGSFNATHAAIHWQKNCSPIYLARFNSAEACYSCIIIRNFDYLIRFQQFLFSDHSQLPILWTTSSKTASPRQTTIPSLQRCSSHNLSECLEKEHYLFDPLPLTINQEVIKPVKKIFLDCYDMRWICRSSPRAALRAVFEFSPGPLDSVSICNTNEAYVHYHHQTYFNQYVKSTSNAERSFSYSLPAFHFRKWADYGSFNVPAVPSKKLPHQSLLAFFIHDSGIIPLFDS